MKYRDKLLLLEQHLTLLEDKPINITYIIATLLLTDSFVTEPEIIVDMLLELPHIPEDEQSAWLKDISQYIFHDFCKHISGEKKSSLDFFKVRDFIAILENSLINLSKKHTAANISSINLASKTEKKIYVLYRSYVLLRIWFKDLAPLIDELMFLSVKKAKFGIANDLISEDLYLSIGLIMIEGVDGAIADNAFEDLTVEMIETLTLDTPVNDTNLDPQIYIIAKHVFEKHINTLYPKTLPSGQSKSLFSMLHGMDIELDLGVNLENHLLSFQKALKALNFKDSVSETKFMPHEESSDPGKQSNMGSKDNK